MNLLHDITPGTKDIFNVIIEIPKGSKNKYEIDKETGLIALDRVMHSAQDYPFDYGFVPQTLWDDGDALDVVLLTTHSLFPGVLVKARPVGIMHMVDGGENDEKILAVPCGDPRFAMVNELQDINPHTLKEIEHFFSTYKQIQKKEVTVGSFEGRQVAEEAFVRAHALYVGKQKTK
jgi:inorganic pyrophosphatase